MLLYKGLHNCLPGVKNIKEKETIYHEFKGYKVKEKEFGLIAIGMCLNKN